jgi:hydrogenase-1 operon protein HyaF
MSAPQLLPPIVSALPSVCVAADANALAANESLRHLELSKDMAVFRPPQLPEPSVLAAHTGALAALRAAHRALQQVLAGHASAALDLAGLSAADRAMLEQVLGEGEVAAQVAGEDGVLARESVFAGVWRVAQRAGGQVQRETIEVGAVPQALLDAAAQDALGPAAVPLAAEGLSTGPEVHAELCLQQRRWQPGHAAFVLNLTLLPLPPADSVWLHARLGLGRVLILSRGYGNCRIVNTRLPRTWRVTYFNAHEHVILDTLEVATIPEVACAAVQDLEDSSERLAEVLAWAGQA